MDSIKSNRKIIWFILFCEELWQWVPGEVNTLVEKLIRIFVNSNSTADVFLNPAMINPGVIIFLFVISIRPAMALLKAVLHQYVSTSIILWLNRIVLLRIILGAGLILYIVLQALEMFNSPSLTLMDLYLNREFWLLLFGGWGLYVFVSPDPEQGV